jgi:beta-glucanase (GH16 family)
MVPPTGADAGYGYGVYSFTLSMSNDAPGPYALLWPATDIWPGPELDVVEQTPGGNAYSTVHWKDDNGDNAFQSYGADGIDTTQVHTYAIDWQRDHIDYFVDGRMTAHVTDQVPLDYADGGQNSAPGVGMQTWWSIDAQHGDNSMTVYDVSYAVVA